MYTHTTRTRIASALAAAFLAGAWNEDRLVARGTAALDPRPRWLAPLARHVLELYHRPPLDRPRELSRVVARFIEDLTPAWNAPPGPPRVRRWFLFEQEMGRMPWPVPPIPTSGDLAAFLGPPLGRLEWLADVRSLEAGVREHALRNYRYEWRPRPGGPPRLIESPKPRLKAIQRRLLHELLAWVPVHDCAHGFVPSRSVRTHAAAHVGRRVVLRFDLEDFFASVHAGRVYGVFRTAGYPESVSHTLTALCTNVVPVEEWQSVPRPRAPALITAHHRLGVRLATPHLPQGAPTSPALANLCAFGLDRRLEGLARALGATYSRYADDLALSGDVTLLRRAPGVRRRIRMIAAEEGFRVNERKSQLMSSAGRQRLCGVVVNARPNVARAEYDLLKATLHNAAADGPQAQNKSGVADFRAHLQGRIAWVESLNPERGAKLRERFRQIYWG